MASANVIKEDNFELEFNRVRENIVTKFRELNDLLVDRRTQLLTQLDTVVTSYNSYKQESMRVSKKKSKLSRTKSFIEEELTDNSVRYMLDEFISQIDTKLDNMHIPQQPRMVSFLSDNNNLLSEINKFGRLVETRIGEIDYKSKTRPVISVLEDGSENGQLQDPISATVSSTTGNIFVVDCSKNCVEVFDSTAKYLYQFGNDEGEGEMNFPRGLAIYKDRILISQGCPFSHYNHSILNYKLDGKYICTIGEFCSGDMEFKNPSGISVDGSNGDIYISDSSNNRVQILFKHFQFKRQFGEDKLKQPLDVKLSQQYIHVLDESNPCVHLFNYNHVLLKSIISRGEGNQVTQPFSFFIDTSGSILITDCNSNLVSFFNNESDLIHKIPVPEYPTGVTVDNHNRVIVVCQADSDCLSIY